jgi:hypothetical protein
MIVISDKILNEWKHSVGSVRSPIVTQIEREELFSKSRAERKKNSLTP